jgi:4-hydroxy 2-oxovalerate aldolase
MEKNTRNEIPEKKGTLLTYRPDIKVLDCTIRDGGLVNSFRFDDEFVKAVYKTNIAAGVDYMEMGYKASKKVFAPGNFGVWKFCSEDDIRSIVGDKNNDLKISVMADAERTDYHEDILPKTQSAIDMIRVATYVHQLPSAVDMIKDAHDKGYETTINLMAASLVKENELSEALEILSSTEVDVIYVVDSFGSLYSEQVQLLVAKYMRYAQAQGKKLGIHTHNNQQLAYANTIEALILGVSYLDVTIAGLGRGAGNCQMELLLGFLKNPKYHLRPVLNCIQNYIVPLKSKISWGFDIPYMITGQLNRHPQTAIKFMDSKRSDYVEFYDSLMEDE